jgi:SCY1-like protein 1
MSSIKYIDSIETETHVYIATERVRPLEGVLRDWTTGGALSSGHGKGKGKGKEDWIGWGVRSISVRLTSLLWSLQLKSQTALAFLNSPPLSQHHAYILTSSIFVTPALEFRLGGFDLLTGRDDSAGVLWGLGGVAPGNVGEVSAPEVKKGGWVALRE